MCAKNNAVRLHGSTKESEDTARAKTDKALGIMWLVVVIITVGIVMQYIFTTYHREILALGWIRWVLAALDTAVIVTNLCLVCRIKFDHTKRWFGEDPKGWLAYGMFLLFIPLEYCLLELLNEPGFVNSFLKAHGI